MKRQVLGLALAAIGCSAAAANWTKVTTEKGADIYVDTSSIKRGKVVKMSHLRNYRTPTASGSTKYSSEKYVVDYDCDRTRSGTSEQRFYTAPMGTGSLFNYGSTSGPPMKPIAPGTLDETLWKIACGRSAAK